MGRYYGRAQDLRAVSAVLACYGYEEKSDAMWEESDESQNRAASMGPQAVAKLLAEEGVPCHVMLYRPRDFHLLLGQPELNYRPILLQIRGIGEQSDPFFIVASLHPDRGAKLYLNLPKDFELTEVPEEDEVLTGVMVVPHEIPPGVAEYNPQLTQI
jgi:hypothetical protein